jgi:Maltooligosyl trehalose synthase
MGMVCENCGWRRTPNNNLGKGCIFSNTKKKFAQREYNQPCDRYAMDTELRSHLRAILQIEEEGMNNKETALYRATLDKWGADAQTAMCVEEMAELTKELCKWKRGKDNFNEIAEEIADVEIMLEQMKLLHGVSAKVETVKVYKRSRLMERLEVKGE